MQLVLAFSQVFLWQQSASDHDPLGEILPSTQLCKYYYSCFSDQNWNASISGAELESGSCKVTNGAYYSMPAAFGIINWSGVGAWHPSPHLHFPTGNSTPVKWGRVINLISLATACHLLETHCLFMNGIKSHGHSGVINWLHVCLAYLVTDRCLNAL